MNLAPQLPSTRMDISSALKSLRNATIKDLQNHKIEAVAAFREIEARLGGFESPESVISFLDP